MGRRPPTEISLQKNLIREAQAFANQHDGMAMMESLFNSMLLEAMLCSYTYKYPDIDEDEIYDVIASAVDELLVEVNAGKNIRRLESYLWKVINNKLYKVSIRLGKHYSIDESYQELQDPGHISESYKMQKDEARAKAIEIAEGLLPRLGMTNVQDVMRYILVALKNGAQDIPHSEIAEALNMSVNNVRVWVSRGFERLAKIVKEERLIDDSFQLPFLEEIDTYIVTNDDENLENEYK